MADEPVPTPDDSPSYKVGVCVSSDLGDDIEWFRPYITDLHIRLWQEWWSEETQDVSVREVGVAEGFLLHVGNAMNDRVRIAEACDDHSAEALEYCAPVIKPKGNEWLPKVVAQFDGDLIDPDLLAFTKMEIKPEHRGQGVGLLALHRMIAMFGGGCGLTLIKPWPLQYTSKEFGEIAKDGKTSQGWTEQQRRRDFQNLQRYYSKLGFERIGKSHFFAFPGFRALPPRESVLQSSTASPKE